MKIKQISVAIVLGLSLLASTQALAYHDNHGKGLYKKEHVMRQFANLDLSDEQKQEMKSYLQQARDEKSIYRADKQSFREQTKQLMDAPAWDEEFATSLALAQTQQEQAMQLSRAKTQHQLFNILTEEQQTEYLANAEQRKQKMKDRLENREDKSDNPLKSKLAEKLDLTDEQIQAIENSREQTKLLWSENKEEFEQMREQYAALIQAKEFDEEAWIAIQNQNAELKTEQKVGFLKARYDMLSVLTDEQKEKFHKVMNKMKDRKGHKFNS